MALITQLRSWAWPGNGWKLMLPVGETQVLALIHLRNAAWPSAKLKLPSLA